MTTLYRNTSLYQFITPQWIWFSLRLGGPNGFAYTRLPGGLYLAWNLEPDYDERIVWQWSKFTLTRLETEMEREEREDAEAEAEYEAYLADHYSY